MWEGIFSPSGRGYPRSSEQKGLWNPLDLRKSLQDKLDVGTHFELRETGFLGRVTLDGLDHGTVDLSGAQWSYKVFVLEKEDIKSVAGSGYGREQQAKPKASCPPVVSLTVFDLHQSGNADTKVMEEKVMNECKKASDDEDTSKGPLVDWHVCSDDMKSREVLATVKLDLNSVFASYVC
ncbi:hypothetical protein Tco_1095267 [Tanacetum coccineum]